MYIYAPTGLALALGQPATTSLSPELETFLQGVRAKPEDHKTLLALVTLHPDPWASRSTYGLTIDTARRVLIIDAMVASGVNISGVNTERVVQGRLRRISADFQKRDRDWQRTIQDAGKVREAYRAILSDLGRRRPDVLWPYLLQTLIPGVSSAELESWKLERVGQSFAKEKFPSTLVERMNKFPAPDAHYYLVGRWLRRYAEGLQKRDRKFKRLVVEKLRALKKKP